MHLRLILASYILATFIGCSTSSVSDNTFSDDNLKLWYKKPASIWEEALPVGNGRIGAMVYGKTGKESIQFNEETVWAGEPGNNILPAIKNYLPEIRQLIFEGKYEEAQLLANTHLPRRAGNVNNYGMCYQPVGNLQIINPDSANITEYYRDLNLSKARFKCKVQNQRDKFSEKSNSVSCG